MKVAYFGFLPCDKPAMGGAEVKSKNVMKALLQSNEIEMIKVYDTSNWKRKVHKLFVWTLEAIIQCDALLIIASTASFLTYLRFIHVCNFIFQRQIHFIPIGKSSPQLYVGNAFKRANKIKGIYVQTESNLHSLEKIGLNNVYLMHNFKYEPLYLIEEYSCVMPLRFCFFSRVSESKGILETLEVFRKLNMNGICCMLDVYGKIDAGFENKFISVINTCSEFAQYLGVVKPEEASMIIKDYFMLVFPTKFDGEGFPGAIIDALAAGVPVLSSRFEFFYDILVEGKTSISFKMGDYHDMYRVMKDCISNPKKICKMRTICHKEYSKYLPKNEIKKIIDNLKCKECN